MGLRSRCAWRSWKTPGFYRHVCHRKRGDPKHPCIAKEDRVGPVRTAKDMVSRAGQLHRLIVDRLMVSVRSTSFDNRSFRLDDEANLSIYDAEFAVRASAVFEQDLTRARRTTYEAWNARPWQERLLEHASPLLSTKL